MRGTSGLGGQQSHYQTAGLTQGGSQQQKVTSLTNSIQQSNSKKYNVDGEKHHLQSYSFDFRQQQQPVAKKSSGDSSAIVRHSKNMRSFDTGAAKHKSELQGIMQPGNYSVNSNQRVTN